MKINLLDTSDNQEEYALARLRDSPLRVNDLKYILTDQVEEDALEPQTIES